MSQVYLPHRRQAFQGAAPSCNTSRDSHSGTPNGQANLGDVSNNARVAVQFQAAASYDCCKIEAVLTAVGTPTFNVRASIWSDDGADNPNSLIGGWSDNVASSGSWSLTTVTFDNVSATGISSGTLYWVVLEHDGSPDASNYVEWEWNHLNTPEIVRRWTGSSWNNVSTSRSCFYETFST